MIYEYIDFVKENGYFDLRRHYQNKYWMYETIENTLRNRFYNNAEVKSQIRDMENAVQRGELTPFMAAGRLLEIYKKNDN